MLFFLLSAKMGAASVLADTFFAGFWFLGMAHGIYMHEFGFLFIEGEGSLDMSGRHLSAEAETERVAALYEHIWQSGKATFLSGGAVDAQVREAAQDERYSLHNWYDTWNRRLAIVPIGKDMVERATIA